MEQVKMAIESFVDYLGNSVTFTDVEKRIKDEVGRDVFYLLRKETIKFSDTVDGTMKEHGYEIGFGVYEKNGGDNEEEFHYGQECLL